MIVYALRDKTTQLYLPASERKGHSFDEPSTANRPRLFYSKRSAQNALSAWLQGHWICKRGNDNGNPWTGGLPEYWEETVPDNLKTQHRKRENMEIVEFSLIEVIS